MYNDMEYEKRGPALISCQSLAMKQAENAVFETFKGVLCK